MFEKIAGTWKPSCGSENVENASRPLKERFPVAGSCRRLSKLLLSKWFRKFIFWRRFNERFQTLHAWRPIYEIQTVWQSCFPNRTHALSPIKEICALIITNFFMSFVIADKSSSELFRRFRHSQRGSEYVSTVPIVVLGWRGLLNLTWESWCRKIVTNCCCCSQCLWIWWWIIFFNREIFIPIV